MTKVDFQVRIDGNGRERFFIDHGECGIDHFIARYVKDRGEMPVIPSQVKAREAAAKAKADAEAKEATEKAAETATAAAEENDESESHDDVA